MTTHAPGVGPPRQWTPLARSLTATGDHWTLAIALQLAPGAVRLTNLRRGLPGISTGVLDRCLQQMAALGLLSRTRYREMPPRVELELTEAGHELLPIAAALARWGMRHVWSDPQAGERIDVGALLRLMPALLEEESNLPDGTLETVVLDPGQTVRNLFQIDRGRLRATDGASVPSSRPDAHAGGAEEFPAHLAEEHAGEANPAAHTRRRVDRVGPVPSARVEGSTDAWIAALGPDGEHEQLRFTGDTRLARLVLHGLPRPLLELA